MLTVLCLVFLFSSFVLTPSLAGLTTPLYKEDRCVIVSVYQPEIVPDQKARVSKIENPDLAKYLEVEHGESALTASELMARLIAFGYEVASTVAFYDNPQNPIQTIAWTLTMH